MSRVEHTTHIQYPSDVYHDLLYALRRAGLDAATPRATYDPHGSRHPAQSRAEAGEAGVASWRWHSPNGCILTLSIARWIYSDDAERLRDGRRIWARLYLPNDVGPVLAACPIWDNAAPIDEVVDLYRRWLEG